MSVFGKGGGGEGVDWEGGGLGRRKGRESGLGRMEGIGKEGGGEGVESLVCSVGPAL